MSNGWKLTGMTWETKRGSIPKLISQFWPVFMTASKRKGSHFSHCLRSDKLWLDLVWWPIAFSFKYLLSRCGWGFAMLICERWGLMESYELSIGNHCSKWTVIEPIMLEDYWGALSLASKVDTNARWCYRCQQRARAEWIGSVAQA